MKHFRGKIKYEILVEFWKSGTDTYIEDGKNHDDR